MKWLTIKCIVLCALFGIANMNYVKILLNFIFGSTVFKLENIKVCYWTMSMICKWSYVPHGDEEDKQVSNDL